MSITNDEYNDWLNNPRSMRVVLYEFAGLRMSNVGYRAWINGVPHPYRPLVNGPLAVKSAIGAGVSVGALELINTGELDGLIGQVLHAQPLTVRWGDPAWDYEDFRLVFSGLIDGLYPSSNTITTLTFFDQNYKLEKSVLSVRAGGSGELVPLALGSVFNAPLLQISALLLQYKASAAPVTQFVAVRDGGVNVAYTPNVAQGSLTLALPPARELRCDIEEPHNTPLAIAEYLAGLAGLEGVLKYSFTTLQDSFKCGLFITGDMTINAALKMLLEPISIYHRVGLTGELELIHINHDGEPDHVLLPTQIIDKSIQFSQPLQPASAVNVHWRRNWSPLAESGLALRFDPASATAADLELADQLIGAHKTVAGTTDYPSDFFSPLSFETCLTERADAESELARRVLNSGVLRQPVAFDALAPGMKISIGDRVQVHHRRFGLANGKTGTVVGADKRFGNINKIRVEMVL